MNNDTPSRLAVGAGLGCEWGDEARDLGLALCPAGSPIPCNHLAQWHFVTFCSTHQGTIIGLEPDHGLRHNPRRVVVNAGIPVHL